MHSSSSTVYIRVSLPSPDYHLYVQAQRNLRRIMGPSAPDVKALINGQITGRDAVGIADEYLDRIGWPTVAGRTISLKRLPKPTVRRRNVASRKEGDVALGPRKPFPRAKGRA